MKLVNKQLASEILDAGKKEFLSKGFFKASMRSIAASINVTTGAIYKYYKDKEALFDAIVKEAADALEIEYKKQQNRFARFSVDDRMNKLSQTSANVYKWMVDYIYDNYDSFKLIICCSNGTKYEHYIERLIDIEVKSSYNMINIMKKERKLKNSIDDNLIHIVVTSFFHGIFESVMHDIPKDEAEKYLEQLRKFYLSGWLKLLEIR